MNTVRRLGWHSRERDVRTDVFLAELSTVDPVTAVQEYGDFLARVKTCVVLSVCDQQGASRFLCEESKKTYLALFYSPYTLQPAWEKLPLYTSEVPLMDYINDYCGSWDNFWFWGRLWLQNRKASAGAVAS